MAGLRSVRNAQYQTISATPPATVEICSRITTTNRHGRPDFHIRPLQSPDLDWSARSGVVYLASTPGFGPGRGGSNPPPGTPAVIRAGEMIEWQIPPPGGVDGQGVRVP